MRVYTGLPQDDLNSVPKIARAIEEAGYDGVATQENRHNPFLSLAVAATSTSNLDIATSVAIAFARSPMATANIGWDLQKASGGRFVLGLGSQVKGHNVRRFSVPWSPPAPRMREYVESLRAIWRTWKTGEPLAYEGEHYQFSLMTPNFTPAPMDIPAPPVTISAVGPATLRVAGSVCDGVQLHGFCTRKYLEDTVMPILDEAREKSGRARENFQISGGGFIATGPDDESVQKMVEWIRYRVGFYGSTRAYWPVFEAHGLEDLGHKLNHMSKTNQWDKMTAEVSDDVVRLFAAVGRYDELEAAVEERFGGIADVVSASASVDRPETLPPDVVQDLKRVSSPFKNFAVA